MTAGITGSSGSGKSTAAKLFAQNGFTHIDLDEISRSVTQGGTECTKEIADKFGTHLLLEDGSLNRRALGEIVFRDEEKLKLLNEITHKYILQSMEEIISRTEGDILLDAPLLFEADLDMRCHCTIGVIADKELQVKRIALRDGISEETARQRISRQHTNEFFIEKCTYCIENSGTEDEFIKNTIEVINKIKERKK